MSDLRTRIAYAIAQADGDLPGMEPDSWDYELADAVIHELNMVKEDGECSYCHAQLPGCRYICDWKTDE